MEYVGGTTLGRHTPRQTHPDKQKAKLNKKKTAIRHGDAAAHNAGVVRMPGAPWNVRGRGLPGPQRSGVHSREHGAREQHPRVQLLVASGRSLTGPAHRRRVLGGDASVGVWILTP